MGLQQPDPPFRLRAESLPLRSSSDRVSGARWPSSPPQWEREKGLWSDLGDQMTSLGWTILGLENEEEGSPPEGCQRAGWGRDVPEMLQGGRTWGTGGRGGKERKRGRLKVLLLQNLHKRWSGSFPAHLNTQQRFVHSESQAGFFLTCGHKGGSCHLLPAAGLV